MNTQNPHPKRPYAAPRLVIYGRVTELTKAVGTKTVADGGSGSTQKTQ
jgi:hypothetical protein